MCVCVQLEGEAQKGLSVGGAVVMERVMWYHCAESGGEDKNSFHANKGPSENFKKSTM